MSVKRFVFIGFVLLFFGCFGRIIESSYYQLDYVPSSKKMLNDEVYPYSVRVKDFDIAEAYRRNNLVYRQSPFQLHFYNYELWAVKPEYMISDVLFRHLESAKMFSTITRIIDINEPDFTINGFIRAIEEYDNQDEWYAHLAMNINLQDNNTKKVIWSRDFDYRKKVSNMEPVYVIRGLSELLELINNEAIADMDSVLNLRADASSLRSYYPQSEMKNKTKDSTKKENEIKSDSLILEQLPPPGEI